jgi:hypothetical protein
VVVRTIPQLPSLFHRGGKILRFFKSIIFEHQTKTIYTISAYFLLNPAKPKLSPHPIKRDSFNLIMISSGWKVEARDYIKIVEELKKS